MRDLSTELAKLRRLNTYLLVVEALLIGTLAAGIAIAYALFTKAGVV